MDKSKNVISNFIDYLRHHGYPENSFIFEYRINKNSIADLAIIDPKTKKLIAICEFKNKNIPKVYNLVLSQLNNIAKEIKDNNIQLYAIFGKEISPYFEVYSYEIKDSNIQLNPNIINDYPIAISSIINKEIIKSTKNIKRNRNGFLILCMCIACVIIAILVLDFLNILEITAERLILISIITAIIIIPFADRLKFLGIEFERFKEKSKDII